MKCRLKTNLIKDGTIIAKGTVIEVSEEESKRFGDELEPIETESNPRQGGKGLPPDRVRQSEDK